MAESEKIKDLSELAHVLACARDTGKSIVHCHGVFDLLHIGHIKHFEQAKKLGDLLIVTITADRFVNKGPHRPAFNHHLRAEAIAALACVDFVAINDDPSAVPAIQAICPTFHVKGSEYRDRPKDTVGKLKLEEEAVIACGGELVFTDDVTFSSTNLINTHLTQFPKEIESYLRDFRSPNRLNEVTDILTRCRDLKVLVVGEAIIDEYRYCEAIGKAGKEPVLVARYQSNEEFAGGTLAIANHIAGFCKQVSVMAYLGSENSREDFIQQRLKPNVTPYYLRCPDRPTITKIRYVENYLMQKLFEVYEMNDAPLGAEQER
jgi:rfaE bifunctional protein nucleotidyltransferase chain/domain